MPKMRAIPQLVSAPSNPIPIVEHFRWNHPQCEHSYGQEMMANICSGQRQIDIILTGIVREITKVHKIP